MRVFSKLIRWGPNKISMTWRPTKRFYWCANEMWQRKLLLTMISSCFLVIISPAKYSACQPTINPWGKFSLLDKDTLYVYITYKALSCLARTAAITNASWETSFAWMPHMGPRPSSNMWCAYKWAPLENKECNMSGRKRKRLEELHFPCTKGTSNQNTDDLIKFTLLSNNTSHVTIH